MSYWKSRQTLTCMEKPPVNLTVITRLRAYTRRYPSQFWLLFWGTLVSTTGMSMIWPFLALYISAELSLPLTTVGSLLSIRALMSLISSFLAGEVTDRISRKWAMVASLAVNGAAFLLMIQADTYLQFALLLALRGVFQPLYRVGADAMLADLVPEEERADAYALNRLSKNAGVALGPALGGLVATSSYSITFSVAAGATIFFSILIAMFAVETLPRKDPAAASSQHQGGFHVIFQDSVFLVFIFGFILRQVSSSMLWTLLAAYAKQNYRLSESLYGLIPTTNALMVVFLQILVTRKTSRFPPLNVMAVGTLLYGLGVSSIALGNGFWGFWISMIIVTLGELMVIPTASSYTAKRAPEDMRGRYMSVLALTWGAGSMVGPLLGGFLNDQISPISIWYGGGAAGVLGALIFLLLILRIGPPIIPQENNPR